MNSVAETGPVISVSVSNGAVSIVMPGSSNAEKLASLACWSGSARSASPAGSRCILVHAVRGIGHASSDRSMNPPSTVRTRSLTRGSVSHPLSSPFRK